MVITELIKTQAYEATVMFAAGLGLGALYSLFAFCKGFMMQPQNIKDTMQTAETLNLEKKEKNLKKRRACLLAITEIAFWIFAAFYITGYLHYASHGEVNFHNFLAMLIGALLWRKLFYGKIKN